MSLICPIGHPLKSSVVATVWRNTCAVTFFFIPAISRKRRNQTSAVLRVSGLIRAHHKEGLTSILSPYQVLFNPVERPRTEENHALFIAFANDGRLPGLEIDGRALEGKPLRDPHAGAQEDLHERPEAKPLEIKPALTFVDRNCGHELLHFFRREVEDFSLGYARTANLLYVHGL